MASCSYHVWGRYKLSIFSILQSCRAKNEREVLCNVVKMIASKRQPRTDGSITVWEEVWQQWRQEKKVSSTKTIKDLCNESTIISHWADNSENLRTYLKTTPPFLIGESLKPFFHFPKKQKIHNKAKKASLTNSMKTAQPDKKLYNNNGVHKNYKTTFPLQYPQSQTTHTQTIPNTIYIHNP